MGVEQRCDWTDGLVVKRVLMFFQCVNSPRNTSKSLPGFLNGKWSDLLSSTQCAVKFRLFTFGKVNWLCLSPTSSLDPALKAMLHTQRAEVAGCEWEAQCSHRGFLCSHPGKSQPGQPVWTRGWGHKTQDSPDKGQDQGKSSSSYRMTSGAYASPGCSQVPVLALLRETSSRVCVLFWSLSALGTPWAYLLWGSSRDFLLPRSVPLKDAAGTGLQFLPLYQLHPPIMWDRPVCQQTPSVCQHQMMLKTATNHTELLLHLQFLLFLVGAGNAQARLRPAYFNTSCSNTPPHTGSHPAVIRACSWN